VEQKALELRYDPDSNKWTERRCLVHMESKPLDEVSLPTRKLARMRIFGAFVKRQTNIVSRLRFT